MTFYITQIINIMYNKIFKSYLKLLYFPFVLPSFDSQLHPFTNT